MLGLSGLLIAITYAPALGGPFVLDDHVNLASIWGWLQGHVDAWSAITQNSSGPTGRPLAYLSFLANATVGGTSPFGFKLVNLMLHLAVAGLAFVLVRRAAEEDALRWPIGLAVAVVLLWAINPVHVSTVMYVVQRMALLAALALLGAVALYVHARRMMERDEERGRLLLFVAVPAVTLVGLLAKETAVLAPLLCAAAELTLFHAARPRRDVRLFFVLFLWIPLVAGVVLILDDPARLLAGYAGREFSLEQRLLSQPRILAEYAGRFLWPFDTGLYRDGYRPSSGWLEPPSTLLAIASWTGIAVTALAMRARAPVFAFGILWFLVAHSLEAGPIALELYFEHRNYLPSLGLAMALAALARPVHFRIAPRSGLVLVGGIGLVLAALTASRSYQWGDIDRLLAHEGPPAGELSRRLQVDRAIRAVERGDATARSAALERLSAGNEGDRAAAALWRAIFACDLDRHVPASLLHAIRESAPRTPTHNHLSWLDLLSRRTARQQCAGLDPKDMRDVLEAWKTTGRASLSAHALSRIAQMEAVLMESPK
jgi:hypothetical protein